jgi:predicted  nucleic acid-binding Zn-ribbon protein
MSNRVEDLETRVQELEATVRGLTEELVESNERIRELEAHHDEEVSIEKREIGVESDRSERKEQEDNAVGDIIVA